MRPSKSHYMKRFQNFPVKLLLPQMRLRRLLSMTAEFATIWNNSSWKMVLVGVNEPNCQRQNSWSIGQWQFSCFTETTSNLHHPSFINNIDTIITPFTDEDFKDFGCFSDLWGMIVSNVSKLLRKYKPKHHWHIDTLRHTILLYLTKHFEVDASVFDASFLAT
jgi:2-succinyl-5-enolpyruvyl-6-hydroxy-3-cyclohexene-1-carboxylate synthase